MVVNSDAPPAGVSTGILTAAGLDAQLDDRTEYNGGFGDMTNRAPVAIWVMGTDQRLQFHNKWAAVYVGNAMSRVLDGGWLAIVHPEDMDGVWAKYSAAVTARRGFRIECRMRRSHGGHRWVLHTGVPRYIHGEFAGHIGTSVDITDLKRNHSE